MRLPPRYEASLGASATLVPMLRYMDNVAMVSVTFLAARVFAPASGVRRGTFIEDTFGKQAQMQARSQLPLGGTARAARGTSANSAGRAAARRAPRLTTPTWRCCRASIWCGLSSGGTKG